MTAAAIWKDWGPVDEHGFGLTRLASYFDVEPVRPAPVDVVDDEGVPNGLELTEAELAIRIGSNRFHQRHLAERTDRPGCS